MEIKFSDSILPFNASNDTNQIKIELEPSYLRSEELKTNFSLTWEIIKIENEILDIQVNFSKPTDVSMGLEQDWIRVTFLNENLIRHANKEILLG